MSAADAQSACSIELIWPPSDGIVLLATDSQSVTIYLKARGNCSQDVRPNYNSSGSSLKLAFALYNKHIGDMTECNLLQHVHASPLDEDQTPVHYRLMRSPLLVKGQNNNLHYDTSGHHLSKEFSVWCFNVVYNSEMRNTLGLHDLESDHMIFEVHLLSDVVSKPVASLLVPLSTFYFRLLKQPSSHFYRIPPRYNTYVIPTNVFFF